MRHIKPILIALLIQVVALFAPVLVLLALPFIRWDAEPSAIDGQSSIRGDLPRWLAWLGTPDERLPGGLYEPAVLSIYKRFGRFFCAWYWLGIRNRVHGFAAVFGLPTSAPWADGFGLQQRGCLWWIRWPLLWGRLAFKAGYRSYRLLDGTFLAVPVFTITKA
jgi:hypothetical protein